MNLFETFSGIGSQHKALTNLRKKNILNDFKVLGISEWYISAIIAYSLIHHNKIFYDEIEKINKKFNLNNKKEIKNNLKKLKLYLIDKIKDQVFSTNSKDPININKIQTDILKKLYVANKINNNLGSILNLNGSNLPNNIDVLTYSFPCQDLSVAGLKKGLNKGTRSGLLWEIGRILIEQKKENNPKILLMENVPTLFNKFKDGWNLWKKKLYEIGYISYDITINSKELNIPQNRIRVFSLAIRKDIKSIDFFNNFNFEKEIKNTITYKEAQKEIKINGYKKIKDILDKDVSEKYYIRKPFNVLRSTDGKTGTKFDLIDHSTYEIANRVYDVDYVAPTLTTSGIIKIYDDKEKKIIRNIKEVEAFKLMGFDEKDYSKIENHFTKGHLYKFAGNSIVINVLETIFEIINNKILKL